tara:strand:+ start:656 stop:763 length:108 start_codon:yes stop_codon:yes gene_type:complete
MKNRKINWNDAGFWIIAILLFGLIVYLVVTGRAWK